MNLPHAATHTIVLPHAVAFNEPAMPEIAARVAEALGAEDAATGLYELVEEIGAPTVLKNVGMKEEYIDEVAPRIIESVPENNPRPVDGAGVRSILESAYAGRRPGLTPDRSI